MFKTKSASDPYEMLARTLNRIPNGFAKAKDGSHLKVLKWIFTPDEAELASKMKVTGETLEKMSKRLKIPTIELTERINVMKSKGQLHIRYSKGKKKYGLLPFVVGIYEDQLFRMDKDFAQLTENYFQETKGQELFSHQPALHKVVPVNRVIKYDLEIHHQDEAEMMARRAKSWGIRECICRKQQELLDKGCDYPKSVCLSFSSRENAYENNVNTKPITLEESLRILREAEEAGLIHSSMNIENGFGYICNCCTCCCGVIRGVTEWNQPAAFVKSNYNISIDEDLCIGCGKCIDRCQFNSLELIDQKCHSNERCVGCGVCAIVCPKDAMLLIPRKGSEKIRTPKSLIRWMLRRTISRRVNSFRVI
ncbi:MAG: 4Fe-4S binding protein [Candidatus Heimdallarchaeota archaeon]